MKKSGHKKPKSSNKQSAAKMERVQKGGGDEVEGIKTEPVTPPAPAPGPSKPEDTRQG